MSSKNVMGCRWRMMKSHGKFRLQLITIKAEGSHENISSLVDYMLIRNSMGRLPRRQLERGGLSLSNPQKVVGRLPYPTSRGRGYVIKIEHPRVFYGILTSRSEDEAARYLRWLSSSNHPDFRGMLTLLNFARTRWRHQNKAPPENPWDLTRIRDLSAKSLPNPREKYCTCLKLSQTLILRFMTHFQKW